MKELTEDDIDWIENAWASYHDNCSDETLIGYFNNKEELDRLNAHRNENTAMDVFNLMLVKALYERNSYVYTKI